MSTPQAQPLEQPLLLLWRLQRLPSNRLHRFLRRVQNHLRPRPVRLERVPHLLFQQVLQKKPPQVLASHPPAGLPLLHSFLVVGSPYHHLPPRKTVVPPIPLPTLLDPVLRPVPTVESQIRYRWLWTQALLKHR